MSLAVLQLLKYAVDNHEWCGQDHIGNCPSCDKWIRCEDSGDCHGCQMYLEAVRMVHGKKAAKSLLDDWADAQERRNARH